MSIKFLKQYTVPKKHKGRVGLIHTAIHFMVYSILDVEFYTTSLKDINNIADEIIDIYKDYMEVDDNVHIIEAERIMSKHEMKLSNRYSRRSELIISLLLAIIGGNGNHINPITRNWLIFISKSLPLYQNKITPIVTSYFDIIYHKMIKSIITSLVEFINKIGGGGNNGGDYKDPYNGIITTSTVDDYIEDNDDFDEDDI